MIDFGISILSKLEQEESVYHNIRPNNIFLNKNGYYRLDAFDAARKLRRSERDLPAEKFDFMAPEACFEQKTTVRSDIYSLGMVMYWLLNDGGLPFLPPAPTPVTPEAREEALRRRVLSGETPPPPADCPKKLADVILRACACRPEKRWPSLEKMANELKALKRTLTEDELNRVVSGGGLAVPPSGEADDAPVAAEDAPAPVEVSAILLTPGSKTMEIGESIWLSATVVPSDAADASIRWSSSNNSVARVDGGRVTAVGVGTAVITATGGNGKSAACSISVF